MGEYSENFVFVVSIKTETLLKPNSATEDNVYTKVFDTVISLKPIHFDDYDSVLLKLVDNNPKQKAELQRLIKSEIKDTLPQSFKWIKKGENLTLRDLKDRLNHAIAIMLSIKSKNYQVSTAANFEACTAIAYFESHYPKEYYKLIKNEAGFASFMRTTPEIINGNTKDVQPALVASFNTTFKNGDRNIERNIEVCGENIKENEMKTFSRSRSWKWINLGELIEQNSFENYFSKHDKLAPIIELFLEPFYVEKSSETRVFLNLVQALETYHSRFVTNDIDEFKQRVDNLLSSSGETRVEEYKTYLLAHSNKFITLESRLADLLLAEWKIHFDTGDINYQDFPSIIAHSRNYYIHYDEGLKDKYRIISQEELQIYNTVLIEILEYYILLEIGFVETNGELKKKITERWGNVSRN